MNIVDFLTTTSVGLIAVFTPVIIGLVQVVKMWVSNEKVYPLAAIIFGIILGTFFGGFIYPTYNVLLGVIAGLSAAGLYSGTRAVAK